MAEILGDDWCVVCRANLADVLLQCPSQHRIYCVECFQELAVLSRREMRTLTCGMCMRRLRGGRFSEPIPCGQVQLEETRLADAYAEQNKYPWEILSDFGPPEGSVDVDTMRNVREAIRRCEETLPSRLIMVLRDQLPEMEFECVFVELIKEVDLHQVLLQMQPLQEIGTPQDTMEVVSVVGIAGAMAGAFVGPAIAVWPMCPLLAALGGIFGHVLAKNRPNAIVQRSARRVLDAAGRLGIDLKTDGFMKAREKFHQEVCKCVELTDSQQDVPTQLADWQTLRSYYTTLARDFSQPAKEVAVHIHVLEVRETLKEDWKLVRSWFGNAMNAQVSESDTQKVQIFTLYL